MKAEIGRRIRKIRVERGLTQKELASKVGIDFTYIGKIERGEQLPSLKILLKIADALSLPFGCFLEDKDTVAALEMANGWKDLIKDERWFDLLKTLQVLHVDDIPLITEIVHVLDRHRKKKKMYEVSDDTCLKAAEEEAPYGKKGKGKKG